LESFTDLLVRWSEGDQGALDELMTVAYDELRKLARAYLRRERHNHTMQPTALVHELYEKFVGQQEMSWQHRSQFYALAAKLMRNILVDRARRDRADKRGGKYCLVSFSKVDRFIAKRGIDFVTLDDALNDLASTHPEHCRVVELRFFGGLTNDETAEFLGVSPTTTERRWRYARAWLREELSK
jgi:RNA polymerase sigma factor (TIGR02999 family)